jgi:aminoglycoside phosphotransferase (APT) family kinase protein
MDASSLLATIAPGASVREITAEGGGRQNRVFRLLEESGRATVVKIYATPSRERRERHALTAIAGIDGVPRLVDRGMTPDGTAWARLTDGGAWSLASLTKNLDAIREAGRILGLVHASTGAITNLEAGIDGAYVATHFRSTVERLGRFRRKLQIAPEILAAASEAPSPVSSSPVTAHTHPTPDKFLVSEEGPVMLVDWEWATLAPPEWDVSFAAHALEEVHGSDATDAFLDGYGKHMPRERLDSWTAYHAAVQLLEAGESRDGRLGDLQHKVRTLADAVGATVS